MPDGIKVCVLRQDDAAAFQAIRLRALREDPVPFLSTYEEEAIRSVEDVAARLGTRAPGTAVLGASRDRVLVGILGFYRHAPTKARHRASLWGMYVAPEERSRGIGKALLDEAIALLRAAGDIEQIELTVVRSEDPARRLYVAAGFEVQGTMRRAMKDGERYSTRTRWCCGYMGGRVLASDGDWGRAAGRA
jgi:ribosomal protein S18 acetylase RimI-like enzyme